MNVRTFGVILGLAAALGAAAAAAQQPATQQPATVARLTGLEGNVLVSQGDAFVAAVDNQRVAVGTRVLTTAGGRVVVNYDVGCEVRLKENERFTVRVGECGVLVSEVVPLGPAAGAIGGGVGAVAGVSTDVLLGVAALGAIGVGAYEVYRSPSVSPN